VNVDTIPIRGAGAIGGTIGAYWKRAGLDVLLVDKVAEHVEACRTQGLSIEGPVDTFTQVIPAVTAEGIEGVFRRVVLAVKAQHTEESLEALAPHLADDGYVLSAQNGLNELVIANGSAQEKFCTGTAPRSWSARSMARSASELVRCTGCSNCSSPTPC
jgi:2-dehydropantoate 2-reductase